MRITRLIAVLALLAALIAIVMVFRQAAAVRRTEAALVAANHESEVLAGRLHQLRQANQELEISQAKAQAASRAGSAREKMAREMEAIDRDPEVHEAVGKLVEWNNSRFFGPLFRSAGLSDAQVQRAEYLLGQLEVFGGLGPVPLSYRTDPRSPVEIQAELVQLIGPAGAASLATYQISRNLTVDLAGNLNASGIPLSSQQLGQLTQILVKTNQQPVQPGGWYNPARTDWSAALAQAQEVLSPAQVAVLKDFAVSRLGANIK
jgi:hypothetical protein